MAVRPRVVKVGSLMVGGDWPVSVQTMWKNPLPDAPDSGPGSLAFKAILGKIHSLAAMGCDILRFAVPDEAAARYLGALAELSPIPLVADIHFDWRLALLCLDYPIAKIRINPGNIGARWKTAEVVAKARERSVPLRIGVNAGSLPEDLRRAEDLVQACVAAAEREISEFEALGFGDILVSMKLNDPLQVEEANRRFSEKHDYPLHLGVTEAGPLIPGVARNTAALVPLLRDGVGSTIRVSLSDTMESEILAGKEILACAGLRRKGVRIISCPRCGRAGFDTHAFVERWADRLAGIGETLDVAIMGCVVNGPGEARHADIGITGAGDWVLMFQKGQEVRKVPRDEADRCFSDLIEGILKEKRNT